MDQTQLEARRAGIGGSDIAALIGLSPWKTPHRLWLEKTGRVVDEARDEAALERMHFGQVLEEVVAREFCNRTGHRVQRISEQLAHPECSIAIANIDRAVVESGSRARWDDRARRVLGATAVLECKTAHAMAAMNSDEWGAAGTADVPVNYWLQCQWYMGITGLEEARLACLFGGQHLRIYALPFARDEFAQLLDRADAWWRAHVIADTPPDPMTEAEARERWPVHAAGKVAIVDASVFAATQRLRAVKQQIADLEAEEDRLRDHVCAAFGEAEQISHAGQVLASWKASKATPSTDWKALVHHHWPVPPADLVEQFTTERPGARRLILKKLEAA